MYDIGDFLIFLPWQDLLCTITQRQLPQLKIVMLTVLPMSDRIVYTYSVVEIETLLPTAVKEMIDSGWALSLYICTYSGSERVTVRRERA